MKKPNSSIKNGRPLPRCGNAGAFKPWRNPMLDSLVPITPTIRIVRILSMLKTRSAHRYNLATQFLCLFLAGLTACSTSQPRYTWHDTGTTAAAAGKKNQSDILESWGAKAESPDVQD